MKDIDKKSLESAYQLYETGNINKVEIGTTKGLQKYTNIYLMDCMILLDKYV